MALCLLWLLHFRTSLLWIVHLFTDRSFTTYGLLLLAGLIGGMIVGWSLWRKKPWSHLSFVFSKEAFIGLLAFLSIDLINTIFLHYQILSAACFLLGGYCLLGFYLQRKSWLRGMFLALLVTLTLPFIEHIQTFLGFPIRLLTAKIVSSLMHTLGVSSISDATVIITENQASVVDLPCSGVKSIYTGLLFLCALYFSQRATLSFRLIGVSVIYVLSLLFFNIWRVFSLVYIYHVLGLTEVGDALHVALGVGGFVASGFLAWFLTKKYLVSPSSSSNPIPGTAQVASTKHHRLIILILICFLALDGLLIFKRDPSIPPPLAPLQETQLTVQEVSLQEIPLTAQEQTFFQHRDVTLSKKYQGKTVNGLPFTLLLVSSVSWRTHHNPEICLQGMGYQLDRSELWQVGNARVKKITLAKNQGTVLYWFASNQNMISDYSERVWEGLLHPKTPWTLVEIGLNSGADTDTLEVTQLIQHIHTALP